MLDLSGFMAMQNLTKYSLGDWIYGVVASLIAAVIFAAIVFMLRWIWHWMRNFSAEYRRSDQTARIIKIFVYRRYIQRANVYSLSRGQFFVISRCLQMFIVGVIFVGMGSTVQALADELKGYDISKGTVRFQASKPLPTALVRKLVKARIVKGGFEKSGKTARAKVKSHKT